MTNILVHAPEERGQVRNGLYKTQNEFKRSDSQHGVLYAGNLESLTKLVQVKPNQKAEASLAQVSEG